MSMREDYMTSLLPEREPYMSIVADELESFSDKEREESYEGESDNEEK